MSSDHFGSAICASREHCCGELLFSFFLEVYKRKVAEALIFEAPSRELDIQSILVCFHPNWKPLIDRFIFEPTVTQFYETSSIRANSNLESTCENETNAF